MVPELCSLQLAPPFVVATMVAYHPTAQPCVASLTATRLRGAVVGELGALLLLVGVVMVRRRAPAGVEVAAAQPAPGSSAAS